MREQRDFFEEFRILLPDGTVKYLEANTHHEFSPLGVLLEVVCTNVDVTERKRAQDERERLRQLEADLAHINRLSMMGELAASLSHEILHPIATARILADDVVLLDALRRVLPVYSGTSVHLYRGETWADFSRQNHGMSWSRDIDIARMFARGRNALETEGGVPIESVVPPDAPREVTFAPRFDGAIGKPASR